MKKLIQAHITLISPTGKTTVPIQIQYDGNEDATGLSSEIDLVYNDIKYQGKGTDYLWVDTFADLQRKLPHDVKLACCMTCRHGNMCPYGNKENQLFCTKDVTIGSKTDMCNLFDKDDAIEKRTVCYYGFCDNFVYQTDDIYTYNDYLYQLSKRDSKP